MARTELTKWCDDLVLELRLLDVSGRRIGDEVAAVESHCAESGQTPREAFGDPREYARSLAVPPADRVDTSPRDLRRAGAPAFAGLLGFLLVTWAVRADTWAGSAPVTGGDLAVVALIVVGTVVIVRFLDAMLHRAWLFVLTFTVVLGGAAAAAALLRDPVVTPPAWALGAAAAALLAVGVVLELRSGPTRDDPVVDPIGGRDRYAPRTSLARARERAGRALGPWLWVLLAGAVVLLDLLFAR